MSKFAYGSLAVLIASAALSCGAAQAQSVYSYVSPAPQAQFAPYAEQAAPAPENLAPENFDALVAGENEQLPPELQRQVVNYPSREAPGTIIIDTPNTYLYLVLGNGKAMRYGIGVGREGFTWSGVKQVARKAEWPDWYPPAEMIARQPYLPRMTAGGPGNPLGARAMYIGGTMYRIHGTNNPATIGHNVSSGCIRLTNEDVIDLYSRVKTGAKVIVLPQTQEARRRAERHAQAEPAPHAQAQVDARANPQASAQGSAQVSFNGLVSRGIY